MINIIGTIFGTSGYAIHTRELANALSQFTDVKLSVDLPMNWQLEATDKELQMIKSTERADVNIIISTPNMWRQHIEAKTNIGFLVWEGDKIPESWIQEIENPDIDYVFVPSQHTKDTVPKELHNKIHIMPHGISLEKFYPKKKEGKPFTFLANKGYRNLEDRGGMQYLMKAYLEEFTNQDNVLLLLKVNPAYGQPDMKKVALEIGVKTNSAPIQTIADNLKYEKMVDVYAMSDVFVAPTRAEAFNIPCLEALACKKPVITTNYGGQAEYCDVSTGWVIGGELKPVEHDLMYEECQWLTPNIDELKKAMREAYNSTIAELDKKGEEGIKKAREMTWEHTAKKIINLLGREGGDSADIE
jgi:glycosyltransferase involved in cell wall biosynthesis